MKKKGLTPSVLDFYKTSYLSAMKRKLLDQDFRNEYHGLAFFYNAYVEEDKLIKIISDISDKDIKAVSMKAFDYDKFGVISLGLYPNVDKITEDVYDIIDSYRKL